MPILVKKPLSILDKSVSISWLSVFRSLGKAIPKFAGGSITEGIGELAELSLALGIAEEPGDAAWLLIRRAITHALADLIRDHRDLFRTDTPDPEVLQRLERDLDLGSEVLEIDERFFDSPGSLDLLQRMREPLAAWLVGYGLAPIAAKTIAERLRPYFVLALHDEWGRRPADYALISSAIDTPFTRAQDLERSWFRYEAHLWRVVNEPMFAEPFGLRAVYVAPRAFWERSSEDRSAPPEPSVLNAKHVCSKKRTRRVVVELASALDDWLTKNDRGDAIRVISGGPGSGKSSFTRMYAAETMTKRRARVLYVPLHLFDPKGDLISAVGDYVRTSKILPANPLESATREVPERLLIIFDGLDELAMQGKLAAETAQQFVREVDKTVDKLNQMRPWLSVLISGRELTIQANKSEFRQAGQVLQLLPYAVELDEGRFVRESNRLGDIATSVWDDPHGLLSRDQRSEWWNKYHSVSGIEPETIPDAFLEGELGDITRQPLLLYLVALSYARNKLTLGSETNLNDVYADLIDAVWSRAYERRRYPGIQELSKEQFVRVLEEVGLAAWHDERRTTTVRTIREHFESASLTKILDGFQQGAEAGVTRLLTAFYFRQHGERDGDRTFEFTHKSFGEYLAACRVVRTVANIHRAMTEHESDPDHGKDAFESLANWAEICGPAALDEYYVRFICREMRRRAAEDVSQWQMRLAALISLAARTGAPMERVKPRPASFHEELRRSRNAEEALFACASACGDVTNKTTEVDWPSPIAAGAWIRRLQGQRTSARNAVIVESLSWLSLRHCHLDILDLYGARLDGAQLTDAKLNFTCFERASLVGADLRQARLFSTNFRAANLANTRFDELPTEVHVTPHLEDDDLLRIRPHIWVTLAGANLTGSTLEKAVVSQNRKKKRKKH